MGRFDYMIANNSEPKKGMEYIYLNDMIWEDGKLAHIDVQYGSIVTDVIIRENRSLEFTLKSDGKRYRCNYGWAFAEHTPENWAKLDLYHQANNRLKLLRDEVNKLRSDVADLSPKKSENGFIKESGNYCIDDGDVKEKIN